MCLHEVINAFARGGKHVLHMHLIYSRSHGKIAITVITSTMEKKTVNGEGRFVSRAPQ